MFGESGVSHTGKMYTYYKCAAAKKKKTCDKKAVRKQWLEDLVVNETMKLVEDDASMNAIIAKVMELQNQESTDLPIYEKQLKETEVGITNMLNAIQMGILTSSTKERLEALEEQRKELQARIAEERLAKPKMKEEFVRFWLLRFRKLDMTQPEQRQALVDTFINAIYLYDDKVLITFNYKEGTETVAFGEAVKAEKSSDMCARGAPDIERQIVRFGVLFLSKKAAAHFLHTVCTACFPLHKKSLVGARPLHLAGARPFCRLKAPLGLSLLRYASQTRTCRGKAPPSCWRKTVRSLKSPTGAFVASQT